MFEKQGDFPIDAFRAPLRKAGDECFILDHPGLGMAVNAGSANREAAMKFVEWMGTPEFAQLLVSGLPGFDACANHDVKCDNPLAAKW